MKPIPYVDCYNCKHYAKYYGTPPRKGAKAPEFEKCLLEIMQIPLPFQGARFCEHFAVGEEVSLTNE